MKKILFIIISLGVVQFTYAQTPGWQNNLQIQQLLEQALKYKQSNDYVNAAKTYLAAYNLDTTNYKAANDMAGVLNDLQDYNTELVWAKKAINLKPNFASAYASLGNAYLGQKKLTLAHESYQRAAALEPQSPYPVYSLGLIEQNRGDIKQAVSYYEQSQKIDSNFYDAFYNMALCYDKLKDYNKAYKYIDDYRMVNDNEEVLDLWKHIKKEIAAQPFYYPTLPQSGKTLDDFIPAGWKIKGKAMGDLNKDGIADAALVLEYKTITAESRADNDTIYSYPRILLVLFKNASQYNSVAQQNTFMLRAEEGDHMSGDPYDTIEINKGVLNINYEYTRSHLYYKFRYQNNNFYLIGATEAGVHLDTEESWDFNFQTRTVVHFEGPISGGAKSKNQVIKLKLPYLKTLNDLKEPFMWQVAKGVMI
jgi:tetratricopeptide (TPR) repeat protein